jgi:hypothetical protein
MKNLSQDNRPPDEDLDLLNTKQNADHSTATFEAFLARSFINPLKPSGNYIYHRLLQSVTLHVVFMDLVRFLT